MLSLNGHMRMIIRIWNFGMELYISMKFRTMEDRSENFMAKFSFLSKFIFLKNILNYYLIYGTMTLQNFRDIDHFRTLPIKICKIRT